LGGDRKMGKAPSTATSERRGAGQGRQIRGADDRNEKKGSTWAINAELADEERLSMRCRKGGNEGLRGAA